MGQIKGFWRDSWWLWTVCAVMAILMGIYVMAFFWLMLPILLGVFLYFAFMRYDAEGRDIGGDQ